MGNHYTGLRMDSQTSHLWFRAFIHVYITEHRGLRLVGAHSRHRLQRGKIIDFCVAALLELASGYLRRIVKKLNYSNISRSIMTADYAMVRTVRKGFAPRLPSTLISLVL